MPIPQYKPEMDIKLSQLIKDGFVTKGQIASQLGISTATLGRWLSSIDPKYADFKEAWDLAKTERMAHFEREGIKIMKGVYLKANASVWTTFMKVQFKEEYGDVDSLKIDLNSVIKSMKDEELDAAIKAMEESKVKKPTTQEG